MKFTEDMKAAVINDYEKSNLTVSQIAEKHHITTRNIYRWTKNGRIARRQNDFERISFRFTQKEISIIIQALKNYSGIDPVSAAIAESIKKRMIEKTE